MSDEKKMKPEIDDYNWQEAFGYAGEPGTNGKIDIRPHLPRANISLAPFTRADVTLIYAHVAGENDGPPWRMVGQLTDGRWFYLEAGCDYTGRDCVASGCATVAPTFDDCVRYACTEEARQVLRIPMPSDPQTTNQAGSPLTLHPEIVMPTPSPILRYFGYEHLPEMLKSVSKPFSDIAHAMDATLPDGAEKSAGLRKLLEAKDCMVRAAIELRPAQPAPVLQDRPRNADDMGMPG